MVVIIVWMNTVSGFTLLEVSVSGFIMVSILLPLVFFQIKNFRDVKNNYYQTIAIIQISSFIDRLRVCGEAVDRKRDFNRWNLENKILLPNGRGVYTCDQNHNCGVGLRWGNQAQLLFHGHV